MTLLSYVTSVLGCFFFGLGLVQGLFEILTAIRRQRERSCARPRIRLNGIVLSISNFTLFLMATGFVISVIGMILSFQIGDEAVEQIELSHF